MGCRYLRHPVTCTGREAAARDRAIGASNQSERCPMAPRDRPLGAQATRHTGAPESDTVQSIKDSRTPPVDVGSVSKLPPRPTRILQPSRHQTVPLARLFPSAGAATGPPTSLRSETSWRVWKRSRFLARNRPSSSPDVPASWNLQNVVVLGRTGARSR